MNNATKNIIEHLETSSLLSNIGLLNNIKYRDDIVVISSWVQAIELFSSIQYENICLEAANRMRKNIRDHSKKRLNGWNDTVAKIKYITQPMVIKKIEHIVICNNLPKSFIDTVQWDILHICMEAEYSDICRDEFYVRQAYWYKIGHFPCGWEGDFPNGKFAVY